MIKQKNFLIKIYDSTGTTLQKTLTKIKNVPTWTEKLDNIPSDTNITLNEKFDVIPSYVDLLNVVKIYEISLDNPSGVLVYTGYISEIRPKLNTGGSEIELGIRHIGDLLSCFYFDDSGTGYTGDWTITYSVATEIKTIVEDIVDHFREEYGTLVDYSDSIDTTSIQISYQYNQLKHIDAIIETVAFTDQAWHWYIDQAGIVHLHESSTTADHTFTIGKDVEVLELCKTVEKIENYSKVVAGAFTSNYSSPASIAIYNIRAKYTDDSAIQNQNSADKRAIKEIVDNLSSIVTGKLKVNSLYDLPSITVGDTCKLVNQNNTTSIFDDNMLIVGITRGWDYVELELGINRSDIARTLDLFLNN